MRDLTRYFKAQEVQSVPTSMASICIYTNSSPTANAILNVDLATQKVEYSGHHLDIYSPQGVQRYDIKGASSVIVVNNPYFNFELISGQYVVAIHGQFAGYFDIVSSGFDY
ncbi:MAG: hypothetical protein ACRCXZ_10810 [Patescibacteria group bacterium]